MVPVFGSGAEIICWATAAPVTDTHKIKRQRENLTAICSACSFWLRLRYCLSSREAQPRVTEKGKFICCSPRAHSATVCGISYPTPIRLTLSPERRLSVSASETSKGQRTSEVAPQLTSTQGALTPSR